MHAYFLEKCCLDCEVKCFVFMIFESFLALDKTAEIRMNKYTVSVTLLFAALILYRPRTYYRE